MGLQVAFDLVDLEVVPPVADGLTDAVPHVGILAGLDMQVLLLVEAVDNILSVQLQPHEALDLRGQDDDRVELGPRNRLHLARHPAE